MTNPLLTDWTGPFGLPPFDTITDADFGPAFDAALTEGRAAIAAITGNPAPATFANTSRSSRPNESVDFHWSSSLSL